MVSGQSSVVKMVPVIVGLLGLTLVRAVTPSDSAGPQTTVSDSSVKLERISRSRLGVKYARDPLGEGSGGTVDRDPLSDWTGVDCVTFVEQCLAEAAAPNERAVSSTLQRIRYREGKIAFESRNHEMVADWLPNNQWLVKDVTDRVGGQVCRWISTTWDRATFFKKRGGVGGSSPETVRTDYVPRSAVESCLARIPTASLVLFIQDRPGILASHCGLVFVNSKGERRLRHASERLGKVVDEPLTTVLKRSGRNVVGIKVCVLRSPISPISAPQ